jgi:hypothetical protein
MSFSFFQLSDDLGKDDDDDEVDAAELDDDHPFKKFERGTHFKHFHSSLFMINHISTHSFFDKFLFKILNFMSTVERPEKDLELSSTTTSTQQSNPTSQTTSQPSTTKSKSRTELQSKPPEHHDNTTVSHSVKEKETTTSSTSISPHTSQTSIQPLKYILVPGNEFDSDIPTSSLTTIGTSNSNTNTNVNLPKKPKTNAKSEDSTSESTSEETKLDSVRTEELKNKHVSKVTTSSFTTPIGFILFL